MLARDQPQPGRQMTAVLEVGAIADRRDHRRRGLRSNATDLGDVLAGLTGLEDRRNLAIKSLDALIDLQHESVQTGNNLANHLSQLIIGCSQNLWNQPPRSGGRDCDSNAAV